MRPPEPRNSAKMCETEGGKARERARPGGDRKIFPPKVCSRPRTRASQPRKPTDHSSPFILSAPPSARDLPGTTSPLLESAKRIVAVSAGDVEPSGDYKMTDNCTDGLLLRALEALEAAVLACGRPISGIHMRGSHQSSRRSTTWRVLTSYFLLRPRGASLLQRVCSNIRTEFLD